jgi:hypothetical protein
LRFAVPPLKLRTVDFPQYGFKWTVNGDLRQTPGLKCRPHPARETWLIRYRSYSFQEHVIPEGITRSRAFRLNVARPPATETRPVRSLERYFAFRWISAPHRSMGSCPFDGHDLVYLPSRNPLTPRFSATPVCTAGLKHSRPVLEEILVLAIER